MVPRHLFSPALHRSLRLPLLQTLKRLSWRTFFTATVSPVSTSVACPRFRIGSGLGFRAPSGLFEPSVACPHAPALCFLAPPPLSLSRWRLWHALAWHGASLTPVHGMVHASLHPTCTRGEGAENINNSEHTNNSTIAPHALAHIGVQCYAMRPLTPT